MGNCQSATLAALPFPWARWTTDLPNGRAVVIERLSPPWHLGSLEKL